MATKIIALALFAGSLVACGGGDAAPPEDATPDQNAATTAPTTQMAALDGATEFANTCSVCHQADGAGMPGTYPPLAGSEIVNEATPDKMIAIILKGLQGPITIEGQKFDGIMTPFESILSDEQIAAITTYERSSFGNTASAVTAAQVAAVRAKFTSVTDSWSIESLEAALK